MAKKKNLEPFVIPETVAIDSQVDATDFEWVGADIEQSEMVTRESISYWKDAMRRLFSNKRAVFFMVTLLIIFAGAIIFPMISPFTISEQHYAHTNAALNFHAEDHVHIFGTDDLGRDIWTRIWSGGRVSLLIAFTAVFANCIIGVIYGGISGYVGGATDDIMMRIIEILNGIPYLMIVIIMSVVLGTGIDSIILAYISVGWIGMARLVRGQIISMKEQEFILAAQTMGLSSARIIAHHLVPNLLSIIIVNVTLQVPNVIFTEAFLSFIGMGVPIPNTSWGVLAQEGVSKMLLYPTQLIIPAVFISVTMLSFNLLGDALRDAFDPKLRR
ncbi:MAG: ABC transporter permease [Lachnospiraceae bacterium]